MEKVTQINEYHTTQLAGWLGKLKATKEGDSNLLDNSMIVYGAGLSDGNRHLHDDLPTLLIGRGGNYFKAGTPRDLPQGNADVELPSDADGSHGRADGALRRRVRTPRSGEPHVGRCRPTCSNARGRGAVRPPIGIAFDGDLGNRIDAVLAIAMLNGLTAKTQARRITLSVSRPSLTAAQLADVVAAFYRGRPVAGPGGGIGAASEGMIGMPEGPGASDDTPPFAAIALEQGRRRHAARTRAASPDWSTPPTARC